MDPENLDQPQDEKGNSGGDSGPPVDRRTYAQRRAINRAKFQAEKQARWDAARARKAAEKAEADIRKATKKAEIHTANEAQAQVLAEKEEPEPPPMDPTQDPPQGRGRGRPKGTKNPPREPDAPIDIPYAAPGGSITDRQKLKLIDLIREARDRKYETLRLYRPLPVQSAFHMSNAHIRILRGGNRCLAPETRLWDPVKLQYRRIDSIDSDFHVHALDETTGEVIVARAFTPFFKGIDDLYEITLENGHSFRATLGHQILTTKGWMSIFDVANTSERILLPSTQGHVPSTHDGDGPRSSRKPGDSLGRCRHGFHFDDGRLHSWSDNDQGSAQQPVDALEYTRRYWHRDDLDGGPGYTRSYQPSFHLSNRYDPDHPSDRDDASDIQTASEPCSPSWDSLQGEPQSEPLSRQPRTTQSSEQSAQDLSNPSWITSISYIRTGEFYDLEVPLYNNYLLATIVNHNSGKTSATMCELAWALSGTHPQEGKYPKTGLRAIVVAKNMDKIGEVIWRTLGRPGAFQMVDDPETGEPRIERAGDREGKLKRRPAPPILPKRLVNSTRDVTWESKKAMIPKKLIIPSNGNECSFYSGQADPFSIQGTKLDLVVLDEEIENEGWVPECMARLVDRGGRFVWGATPQTGTQKLYELYLRALEEQELGVEDPLVEEFVLSIYENPFISEADRQMFLHSLDDEDQIRVRIEGEHAIAGFKIFSAYFFPRGVHGIEPFAIPDDWTRFCAVDPGSQVAAVIFGACPPKQPPREGSLDESLYGDFIYIYDEIYIRRCDATKLAREMKGHIGSQVIHTMLLDHHGGNLTEIGTGRTPEQQYKDAFQKARVPVPLVGRYFVYGSDDLAGGILRIKEWLRLREDGTPKIKILSGSCPQLVAAMSRYQWKIVNGVMTDKPLAKNCDMCDSLRYLVMHPQVRYHAMEHKERKRSSSWDDFVAWRKREKSRKRKESGSGITL